MDAETGTISGTPEDIQDLKKYTITVKNKGGQANTTISIVVEEKPINWVLIIVLIVVALIVIAGVIIGIVSMSKKKPAKKMPAKSSKTAKPTTAVKTKGNVKV